MKETASSKKYDIKLQNSNENTSHGKILTQIKPNSIVLECGCATGYMTRWMSEEMHCHVSIVEIDEDCYNEAKAYAEDGFCGDLMEDGWFQYFQHKKYDYILFADVLEHLTNPLDVLKKTKRLLKTEGKIIISIPNIAHNDIIMKLSQDLFTYTKVGLLDNTHVHFWGRNNLEKFFKEAGLSIVLIDATYAPTGSTEQYLGDLSTVDYQLMNLLYTRPLGEVYQYIITAQKKEYVQKKAVTAENMLPAAGRCLKPLSTNEKVSAVTTVFYQTKEGYNADNCDTTTKYLCSDTTVEIDFSVNIPKGCRQIRLDPCEGKKCLVEQLSVTQSTCKCQVAESNGISIENAILFDDKDPQILIDITEINGGGELTVQFTLRVFSSTQEAFVSELCRRLQEEQKLLREKQEETEVNETSVFFKDRNGQYLPENRIVFSQRIHKQTREPVPVHLDFQIPQGCNGIRIDPCENKYCSVSGLKSIYNGKKLNFINLNGYTIDGILFFDTEDPQIEIVLPDESGMPLHLDMELRLFDTRDLTFSFFRNKLNEYKEQLAEQKQIMEDNIQSYEKKIAEQQKTMDRTAAEYEWQTAELRRLAEDKSIEYEQRISKQNKLLEQKAREYEQQISEQHKLLEQKAREYEQRTSEQHKLLEEKAQGYEQQISEQKHLLEQTLQENKQQEKEFNHKYVNMEKEIQRLRSIISELMILSDAKEKILIKKETV